MRFPQNFFKLLVSIPKSLYLNFRVLPFDQAIRLPILISYNTKVKILPGAEICIEGPLKPLMIKYNFSTGSTGVSEVTSSTGYLSVGNNAKLIFNGKSDFARGISIRCDSGTLVIGNNLSMNRNCSISCSESIIIGENCLIGWETNIRDSDGHNIYDITSNEQLNSSDASVVIGYHTWLAAQVDILKGVHLSNDTVVGYNSCVTKSFNESNILLAGYPATIKKRNISWKE